MICFDEALRIVRENSFKCSVETVVLDQCQGRTLTDDIIAPRPSPAFDNSAVDGFALGSVNRKSWQLIGTIPAGDLVEYCVSQDEAMQILTGARTPKGAAAILMQEEAEIIGDLLTTQISLENCKNIRRMGEDFPSGTTIIKGGTRIDASVCGELAALGKGRVNVRSLPTVALLATGDELVAPGSDILTGQVFESNSCAIAATLRLFEIVPTMFYCNDSEAETTAMIQQTATNFDVVITLGGVSVGARDFVKSAVAEAGFRTRFSGVAVRPGKPVSFGTRSDGKTWIGLPGNPMSALTTFLLLGLPYLGFELKTIQIPISDEFNTAGDRELFIPAKLDWGQEVTANIRANVGSHSVTGFGNTDGLLRLAPGNVAAGTACEFRFFPWRMMA